MKVIDVTVILFVSLSGIGNDRRDLLGSRQRLWNTTSSQFMVQRNYLLTLLLRNYYPHRKKTATACAFAKQGRGLIKAGSAEAQSVQVFGKKKTATACAFAKQGRGLIKVNGQPIENIEPECLRLKAFEPVLILGQDKFANLDIRIRVKGGGYTAQIYAIRSAIAKSIVAYYAKYVDESAKNELRATLLAYDRNLLVADPRRREPKKYGGRGARARFQKSYR
eukprot:CAMPEP_0201652366 /NCGR_PEP_ID=MMETSP0493-20130528/44439_1 /ASSEMBLY_ACC=CAM_ASM_000838 /TAXON_ID=420259 /ORGANISM="Thalassiosira gravida, Strain GMp14c1" /LENGTH=221 /DNA_ID=CAMNT_0048128879 /DNA_START=1118 /DNA_END=1785 /DNA_ORIENTATION=+